MEKLDDCDLASTHFYTLNKYNACRAKDSISETLPIDNGADIESFSLQMLSVSSLSGKSRYRKIRRRCRFWLYVFLLF